jgi:RecJ-like exonuclease
MKKILKISFIISILGIIFLLVISLNMPPKKLDINKINENLLNKKVVVSGEIVSIRNYSNFQIILLKDSTGEVNITIYQNLDLKKLEKIKVIGIVKEYKNNLQIESEKIEIYSI